MDMDFLFRDYDSYIERQFESQYDEDRYVDKEFVNIIKRLELLGEEYNNFEEIPF
jgi:hypothetical protein